MHFAKNKNKSKYNARFQTRSSDYYFIIIKCVYFEKENKLEHAKVQVNTNMHMKQTQVLN